ncbi:helix-turn-helix transcriptional regulator [Streptomyces spongiae]|uniref:Helix-turn-helix transcriptional regulator n=1 Tax=Streptomyces spongiae TaxID=565072 RepID=A0A5N8XJC4_9ACTN|nr:helix-turn-helix transcriptional regulator [Streptomyces spongiae]
MLRGLPALAGESLSSLELAEAVSLAVRPVVAHDALRLMGNNPDGVGHTVFSFWHNFETEFGRQFMQSYLAGKDPCLPADLIRQTMPAGLVGTGHGKRDLLARQLFDAHGVGGELRVLLRDVRGVWGSLALLRSAGGRAFDRTDAARVLELAPVLISALRQYVRSGPMRPVAPDMAPGVFVVDADGNVTGATPMASWWAERLREHHPSSWVDALVAGMAAQTRLCLRQPAAPAPVMHGPAARFGRWISAEGQLLNPGGAVAVLVRAVPPRQLLGSLGSWYGITARERQVIEYLLDGSAAKQIARHLDVSLHTVHDHLKSVYRKLGVSGRAELLTALNT